MAESVFIDARYSAGANSLAKHTHSCYEIIFLKEGRLSLTVDAKKYIAVAPSLIFLSRLEQHSITVLSEGYKRYWLCISPALAGSYIQDYTLLTVLSSRHEGFSHVLNVSACEDEITRIFSRCTNEFSEKNAYRQQMEATLLTELLVLVYRLSPKHFTSENLNTISLIWQIQCRFEERCSEQYSLAALAEEYHMSACYLSHLFKKVTGYSVMQYLTMCRLSLARQLLSETSTSVTDIVFASGFTDVSNFSRLFKRETGVSPNEYRKKGKK